MADLGAGTTLPSSPPAQPGDTFFDETVAQEKVLTSGLLWVPLSGGGGAGGGTDVTIVGSIPLTTTAGGSAATGVAQDTGGSGEIGWLSSAVKNLRLLAGTITGTALKAVLQAGSAIIGKVGIDQTTPGVTNAVQVAAALPAGGNVIGAIGIDQTTPGITNAVQIVAALPVGNNVIGGVGIVAGAAIIGKVGIDQTTPGITNGVQVNAALPVGGNTIGNVGLIAGTAIVGKFGIDQTTPGTTNAIAVDGTGATGIAQDTGGTGTIGWLSSIVKNVRTIATALAGTISTLVSSGTSVLTSVASSATTVVLLPANPARKGFAVYNESTSILRIAYAGTASATAYTVKVPPDASGGYYEVLSTVYTGAISGIWDSANGSARITELT